MNGSAHFGRSPLDRSIAATVHVQCDMLWNVDRKDSRSLLFRTRGQMSNVFIQYFYMRIVADTHGLRLHERKNVSRKKINMIVNESEAR